MRQSLSLLDVLVISTGVDSAFFVLVAFEYNLLEPSAAIIERQTCWNSHPGKVSTSCCPFSCIAFSRL